MKHIDLLLIILNLVRNQNQGEINIRRNSGVGPARRKALLKHFKDVENIKKATLEELESVDEIPKEYGKICI